MHPSNKYLIGFVGATLVSGVALWEGKRNTSYEDLAGVLTVCYGYTGKDIVRGKKYSDKECETLLRKEIVEHSKGVVQCINKPMEERHYNAFVLMAYNVGTSGFCNSRAARLFNEGKIEEACRAIAYTPSGTPAWSYVNKTQFVQGLHNRRLYEMRTCLGADNAKQNISYLGDYYGAIRTTLLRS